jgi:myosin heavy subunit
MGILALLDEESLFPKATDQTFLNKLNTQFAQKGHPKYKQPRFSKSAFTVSHYAGDVEYEITNWLDKNKDPLQDDLSLTMKKSTLPLVAKLFSENITGIGEVQTNEKRGKGASFITVGAQYKV